MILLLSDIAFISLSYECKIIQPPNGLRYWRWGGRGLCLGAEKTRSQKKA
jgi:hypothetical protein